MIENHDIAIIGFTRFSLVIDASLRWFRSTRDLSLKDAQKLVFNDERLDLRFAAFESTCFATYAELHRRYSNAYGVILVSQTLPGKWKERLHNLAASAQGIVIKELPDDCHFRNYVRDLAVELAEGRRSYTFRLDDDDALAADIVSSIIEHSKTTPDNTVLSFSNGLQLVRYGDDRFRLTERHYPLNAQGLGLFRAPGDGNTALHLGKHTAIAETMPVTHSETPGRWLRFVHNDNDSRTGIIKTPDLTARQTVKSLELHFPQITTQCLLTLPIRDINKNDFA